MADNEMLEILYLSEVDPIAAGWELLGPVIALTRATGPSLGPDRVRMGGVGVPYDETLINESVAGGVEGIRLSKSDVPGLVYHFESMSGISRYGLRLTIHYPLRLFGDSVRGVENTEKIVAMLRGLARLCPPVYGYAHHHDDRVLGRDPHFRDEEAPKTVYEAYWLTMLGAAMVDELGRERVLAAPAHAVEELSDGSVFVLTSGAPGDALSDEARKVQAAVLAHLDEGADYHDTLARLRARSDLLAPVGQSWDPDIEELLEHTLRWVGIKDRRGREIELSGYRPPRTREVRPACDALPADVDMAAVHEYEELGARFLAQVGERIAGFAGGGRDEILAMDRYFWTCGPGGWGPNGTTSSALWPSLGAYLGQLLVSRLGGRWVPRKKLEEAQVVVGERAYLPFLRAKRYLESRQAVIDCSLSKYFREAERARGPG